MPKRKPFRNHNGDNKRQRNSGFTLPGYKFLGPGNDLDNATPSNYDDYVAQDHDFDYGDIENAGINPYTTYTEADEIARTKFGSSYGGNAGKLFFGAKKLASKVGLIRSAQIKKRHHYIVKKQSNPRHHFIEEVAKGNKVLPVDEKVKPVDSKVLPVDSKVKPVEENPERKKLDEKVQQRLRVKKAEEKVKEAYDYMRKHPFDARAYRAYVTAQENLKTIQSGGETEEEALQNRQQPAAAPIPNPTQETTTGQFPIYHAALKRCR